MEDWKSGLLADFTETLRRIAHSPEHESERTYHILAMTPPYELRGTFVAPIDGLQSRLVERKEVPLQVVMSLQQFPQGSLDALLNFASARQSGGQEAVVDRTLPYFVLTPYFAGVFDMLQTDGTESNQYKIISENAPEFALRFLELNGGKLQQSVHSSLKAKLANASKDTFNDITTGPRGIQQMIDNEVIRDCKLAGLQEAEGNLVAKALFLYCRGAADVTNSILAYDTIKK